MSSNRMDELFSRLEHSSSAFADRATELSEMILEFEQRLHSVMTGKFSASVTHEPPPIHFNLAYTRIGGLWRLSFATGKINLSWRPLEEAAVKYKILAVGLFEELLKEIVGKQEEQAEELNRALDRIEPFLIVETDQEGGE